MYSDGISRHLDLSAYSSICQQPQTIADRIMLDWGNRNDDATVLIGIEDKMDPSLQWVEVDVSSDVRVLTAAELAGELAKKLGFSQRDQSRTEIAVAELARNILVHAKGKGKIIIRSVSGGGGMGIIIVAKDSGPGIADIEKAIDGGLSNENGLGIGLSGAKRLMDDFRIETELGRGTTVTAVKWKD